MAELTKEYFDQAVSGLATKDYLDHKLADQANHFDEKIDEQTEALARMVNAGFEEVYRRLDVRDQVDQHERDIREIKQVPKLA